MLQEPFISTVECEFIYKNEFRVVFYFIVSYSLSENVFWNFHFFLDLVRHSGRWGKYCFKFLDLCSSPEKGKEKLLLNSE